MKQKFPFLTIFAISTTLTILLWIVLDAYKRLNQTNIQAVPHEILLPLTPRLETQTIENLEKRRFFSEEEISRFRPVIPSPTANPTPLESTASGSLGP